MPPVAAWNLPVRPAAQGAGERAGRVAKELGLEQAWRERAAVDRVPRPRGARAGAVDRVGEQLLARAGLGQEHHRQLALRELATPLHRGRDRGVLGDDRREGVVGRGGPRGQERGRRRRGDRPARLEHGQHRDDRPARGGDRIDPQPPRAARAAAAELERASARRSGERLAHQGRPVDAERVPDVAFREVRAAQIAGAGVGPRDQARRLDEQRRLAHAIERAAQHPRDRGAGAGVGVEADQLLERARGVEDRAADLRIGAIEARGRVEHRDRPAIDPADRRGVADEIVVAAAEVGVAVDLGRSVVEGGGADRVGAAGVLAPARALDQQQALGDRREPAAAAGLHDHAIGVGEQQQEVAIGDPRGGAIEDRIADRAQQLHGAGVGAQRVAADEDILRARPLGRCAQRARPRPAPDQLGRQRGRLPGVERVPRGRGHVVEDQAIGHVGRSCAPCGSGASANRRARARWSAPGWSVLRAFDAARHRAIGHLARGLRRAQGDRQEDLPT